MQIDWWTLALQAVNVLVLVWLLSRLFFRPIAGIIAERQRLTASALSEAAAARQAAQAAKAEAEDVHQRFAGEHDKIVADARAVGETARKALLDQAAKDAAALKSAAEAAIARERRAAATATLDRAGALAVDIAARLVAQLPVGTAAQTFRTKLCDAVAKLPDDAKAELRSAAGDQAPEVITAASLADAEREAWRRDLAAALGSEVAPRFRVDPALIAGAELNGPRTIVAANWRGDLDRIREGLKGDDADTR